MKNLFLKLYFCKISDSEEIIFLIKHAVYMYIVVLPLLQKFDVYLQNLTNFMMWNMKKRKHDEAAV